MATTIYDLIDAQGLRRGTGYFDPEDDYGSYRQISNSYYLQRLSVKIKTGESVSMIEVFESMEIYEDIFSSVLYGSVRINDTSGGFSAYGITGGESISLVACKSVDNPDIIIDRDDFIIYQISDYQMIDQKLASFRMHFISKSGIEAEKKRLFRTFQGERRISALTTELYKLIASEGDLYSNIDDTKCRIDNDFVCAGYTPLDAIENLARRACASGDYYLFFERLHKFNGKKHVITSTKVMQSFNSNINIVYNITTQNYTPSGTVHRATQISFVDNYNHMQNMMAGLYNSNIKILDIIGRDYTDISINYNNDTTGPQASLEENNYFNSYQNFFPEQPGERIVARSYNDTSSNNGGWLKVDTVNGVILSMFRLIVDMPGSNLVGVGNYVNLAMPSGYAIALNVGAGVVPTDDVYSGSYLVTAVKHIFTNTEYKKKVEVSRMENNFNFDTALTFNSAITSPPPVPPPAVADIWRWSAPPPPPPPAPPPPPDPPPVYPPAPAWEPVTCFPAGSLVLMADGTQKLIETITISDILMGADGLPTRIKAIDLPILGPNRKMLSFAEDRSMRWSDEHLFWGRNSEKQWWWTANHEEWLKEVELGIVVGLKDNYSFLSSEGFQFANMDGFVDRNIVDVTYEYPDGPMTKLYLPISENGVPIIVNGYVVTGGTDEYSYDYTKFDWNHFRSSVINKLKKD